MLEKDDFISIGRVAKPHGVKGEVELLYSDSIYMDLDFDFAFILKDGILIPFAVEGIRGKSHISDIVKLAFIDNESEALEIKDCAVWIERDASMGGGDTEELSLASLLGYSFHDIHAGQLGIIVGFNTSSINQLVQVKLTKNGYTIDIPFHEDLIDYIDTSERSLTMILPDGFLSIYE